MGSIALAIPKLRRGTCFKTNWRQIWSDNPHERLNEELRQRTDVAEFFGNRYYAGRRADGKSLDKARRQV
ncbi:MAG: transposase [Desulfovibrio sp.]|nr:transposase [Desulfovibrio sp.]